MADADSSKLLDASAIAELRTIFGPAKITVFVDALLADLRTRPALIQSAIDRGDGAMARADAHRLKGAMGYFGPTKVTEIADLLEHCASERLPDLGDALRAAADRLDRVICTMFHRPSSTLSFEGPVRQRFP